jgi:hypothetical protein
LTELKAHWRGKLNSHAQNITPNVWKRANLQTNRLT